jgi:hypothetical protein
LAAADTRARSSRRHSPLLDLPIRQVMGVAHYLSQPALPQVPGRGGARMDGGARDRAAPGVLFSCRLHAAIGDRRHRLAERGAASVGVNFSAAKLAVARTGHPPRRRISESRPSPTHFPERGACCVRASLIALPSGGYRRNAGKASVIRFTLLGPESSYISFTPAQGAQGTYGRGGECGRLPG